MNLAKFHLEGLKTGEITFSDLVSSGVIEWVDAEEEEDLLIAPRPFDLPELSPKNKRPMDPAKVEWTNLGDEEISKAKLKVEVQDARWVNSSEKFSVPLNYHQKEIETLRKKEKKDNTVLVYTHVEIDPQLILGRLCGISPLPRTQLHPSCYWRDCNGEAESGPAKCQLSPQTRY